MLPSDPEAMPHKRGWDILSVFAQRIYGTSFNDTLQEQKNDSHASGFSDVGIRNLLFTHILNLRPEAVLEIGSHIGTASVVIGQALKLNNFGTLYTVEPQETYLEKVMYYVKKAGLEEWVKILSGFSYDSSVREELSSKAPFEIIFVDANHNYLAVREELKWCWSLLADNGLIFFHDTSVKGQSFDTEKNGGVRRALVEAKEELSGFNIISYEYPFWLNPCGAAIACKQRYEKQLTTS